MANEIQISAKLYAAKGGAYLPNTTYTGTLTMAGTDMASQTLSIGTTEETISPGTDVTLPAHILIANLDSTNFVQVGFSTGSYKWRLRAGEFCLLPYLESGVTIYAKADTAACTVQVSACEV